MSNQQIIQIVVVVLLMGLSGIGWIMKRLQEQAMLRRAEQERERRRLESLRTGRPVEEDAPRMAAQASAQRQLEELAQRRAAQLQELRRLQQARQRAVGGPGGPAPRQRPQPGGMVSIPGSSGPTVPGTRPARRITQPTAAPSRRPAPPARTTPEQAEYNRRRSRQEMAKAQQVKQAGRAQRAEDARRSQTEQVRPAVLAPEQDIPPARAAAPTPGAPEGAEGRGKKSAVLTRMTLKDWRRAFLAQEVFGPPLSVRQGPAAGTGPSALRG